MIMSIMMGMVEILTVKKITMAVTTTTTAMMSVMKDAEKLARMTMRDMAMTGYFHGVCCRDCILEYGHGCNEHTTTIILAVRWLLVTAD